MGVHEIPTLFFPFSVELSIVPLFLKRCIESPHAHPPPMLRVEPVHGPQQHVQHGAWGTAL